MKISIGADRGALVCDSGVGMLLGTGYFSSGY